MGLTVTGVDAWEVLDSRGTPTVRARVEAGEGAATGTFTVPAGASTGSGEVSEARDGGDRYGGRGVRAAARAAREELGPAVAGHDATDQRAVDETLRETDGTPDLSRLGGNAVLAVSGAVAHAAADALDRPLHAHVRTWAGSRSGPASVPLPMVNVLSGGLHAAGGTEVQDFLIVPVGATTYPEALEWVWSVRAAVRERLLEAGHRPLVADEGGFSPPLCTPAEGFDLLAAAVGDAGLPLGDGGVAFAVDVAATHFHDPDTGEYVLESLDRRLDAGEMVDLVASWAEDYPLVSVEDPLAEDDWAGWRAAFERLGGDLQVLGDDLLVTDVGRLERAVEAGAANAVLVKPNQAGTLTAAVDVVEAARAAGAAPVVSARSGETCDATIADLAVGLGAGQIKVGSLARSERLAKYNRLLGIDRDADSGFAGAGGSPLAPRPGVPGG